jgi:hypothetical protein
MGLEIVVEFALRENYCIEQLLDLWVALLGVGQDLADVVHRPLNRQGVFFLRALHHDYGANHLGGRSHVEVQRLAVLRRCKDRGVGKGRL